MEGPWRLDTRHGSTEDSRKVRTLHTVEILWNLEVLGHLLQPCDRGISPWTQALQ